MKKIILSIISVAIALISLSTSTFSWMEYSRVTELTDLHITVPDDNNFICENFWFNRKKLMPITLDSLDNLIDGLFGGINIYGEYQRPNKKFDQYLSSKGTVKALRKTEIYFSEQLKLGSENDSILVDDKIVYFRNSLRIGFVFKNQEDEEDVYASVYEYIDDTNLGYFGGEDNFAMIKFHEKLASIEVLSEKYNEIWSGREEEKFIYPNSPDTHNIETETPIFTLEANVEYTMDIYIWIEGYDADCVTPFTEITGNFQLEVLVL